MKMKMINRLKQLLPGLWLCSCFAAPLALAETAAGKPDATILRQPGFSGVTIRRGEPVPITAPGRYRGALRYEVLDFTPGACLSVRLVALDRDRKEIAGSGELGPLYQLLTVSGLPLEAERFITPSAKAAFLRLDVRVAGNPCRVRIDASSIAPAPKPPLFRGLYTPKNALKNKAALLEKMKQIPPARSEVAWDAKARRPLFRLNGEAVPVKAYKGSRDYGPLTRAGANITITFASGTTLFWDKMTWDAATRQPDGRYDFSRLENELAFIHQEAPGARVLLTLNCDVGEDFFRRHPDSIFRNEAGERGVRQFTSFAGFGVPGPNPAKNRHWAVSYASEEYQQYVEEGLRAVAGFLRTSPAGRIVAGFTLNGGHDDQFFQWEYAAGRGQADYSPASLRAYRRYLKEKYRNDRELQKAWLDPAATLETATLFSEKEWKTHQPVSASAPGIDRKIADGREFMSLSIARMLNRFGRVLKQSMDRPVTVASYYSSPIWRQSGRQHLAELTQDGMIDILFQVSGYSVMRFPGGLGASANFAIDAAHRKKALFVQEMDHRTWRSQITAGWDQHQAAEPANPAEFRAQILRDAGSLLAYGGDGFFLFDMFDSWYNDPEALGIIGEAFRIADWQNRYRDEVPGQEVAVFLDEKEGFFIDQIRGEDCYLAWRMAGLTPALYLLDDLPDTDPSDYRLWILPGSSTLTARQLERVKQVLATPGKVVLITGTPGALTLGTPLGSCESVLAQLGMRIRMQPGKTNQASVFAANTRDPLLKGCAGRIGFKNGSIDAGGKFTLPVQQFRASVADPGCIELGYWADARQPSLAVKRFPGGGTLIYSAAADGVTPQFLANAAMEAGVRNYALPGNSVSMGNGVAAIHRLGPPVELRFGSPMAFFDSRSGEKIGEGQKLQVPCQIKTSRVVLYRPINL